MGHNSFKLQVLMVVLRRQELASQNQLLLVLVHLVVLVVVAVDIINRVNPYLVKPLVESYLVKPLVITYQATS